jgi:CRISPR-associated protein Csb2
LVTAFPAIFERRVKGPVTLDHVTEWCRHAGLPDPVRFRAADVPLVPGAAHLRPHQVFRNRDQHRPYCHLELWFAEPVTGPAAVGRGRQFGLGLLVPVDQRAR